MRKLLRFLIVIWGLLTLGAGVIALVITLLPHHPQSQAARAAIAGAVQRWAGFGNATEPIGQTKGDKKNLYQCSMHPQIISEKPELCPICQMRLEPVDEAQASPPKAGSEPQKQLYQCSMHPQIISDKPDLCPICQMRLEPVEDVRDAGHGEAKERKPMFYRHPMRPDVTSPNPAKDEMGMDYIPVYEDGGGAGTSEVPGHAPFNLSTQRQQLIGVRRSKVERRDLNLEIRAVGKVAHDPDLYQAIVEYQEALGGKRRIAASESVDAHAGADAIVRSAALRLRQLGLSEQQLRQFAEDGRPPINLLLPGKSVWVYAQVYEYEVPLVRAGQPVTITAPSQPGRSYTARVAAIDPILSAATRTARVRIEVATPDSMLRPETFVHVKILVPSENQTAVPEEAVLDTGDHQIVFVVSGEGSFEPRSVKLGRLAEGHYEVLSGLTEGEEVVTSANFLIDSESRFRSAVAAFSKNAGSATQPASPMQ